MESRAQASFKHDVGDFKIVGGAAAEQKDLSYNFADITEFNPALIYRFDIEGSVNPALSEDPDSTGYVLHSSGQYKDMYEAYHYAQTVILPAIKAAGIAKITPAQFLGWLNQLHARIAKTLANDHQTPEAAGAYSQQQILRWQQGDIARQLVIEILNGTIPLDHQALLKLASAHMEPTELAHFKEVLKDGTFNRLMGILKRLQRDKSIKIPEDQKRFIDWKNPKVETIVTLNKLVVQFHANKLSAGDAALVQRIVKICVPPSEYAPRMQKFAEEILAKWSKCEPKDLAQVSMLARDLFYGITEIHPYFNCNGRVSTAMMNVCLRSLGHPSILMRVNQERDNPNSSYSQAIKQINTAPALLAKHIQSRLEDKETHYSPRFAHLVMLRMRCGTLISQIQKDFPLYNLERFYKDMLKGQAKTLPEAMSMIEAHNTFLEQGAAAAELIAYNNQELVRMGGDALDNRVYTEEELQNEMAIFGMKHQVEKLNTLHQQLQQMKAQPKLAEASAVVQRVYTKEEKAKITEKLEALTGKKGWKTLKGKTGLMVMAELGELSESELLSAKALAEELTSTKALNASVKKYPNTNNHVLCGEDIHPELLQELKALKSVAADSAVKVVAAVSLSAGPGPG